MQISQQFLQELADTVRAEALALPLLPLEPTNARLDELARRLEALRDSAAKLVRPLVERLEPSDPLRTPVGLLDAMGRETDEVTHTSTIAWLLSPNKRHEFGKTLLEAVFPLLTGVPDSPQVEIHSVEAERNLLDAGGESVGRLDILVSGTQSRTLAKPAERFVIAVEAKVDADEGEEQLARYEEGIECLVPPGTTRYLVFLTKEGRGTRTATLAWRTVSFEDVAVQFYRAFRQLDPMIPGYHLLRYYLATIFRDMAGWQIPLSVGSPSPVLALHYLSRVGLVSGMSR